jgi:hypothetical protein
VASTIPSFIVTGSDAGTSARTARATARAKRSRASGVPPQASVRRLATGDPNSLIR